MHLVSTWYFGLDGGEPELAEVLSHAERERAGRFVFEQDRRRFITGRGRLRQILASRLGTEPAALEFETNPSGKPYLRGGPEFNLSHSAGRAVLAVSSDGPVGVDIEALREVESAADIAATHFCAEEAQYVLDAETNWRFLRIWTRKEACVKAVGVGLSVSLTEFDTRDLSRPVQSLRVTDIDAGPGWLCAIALPWEDKVPEIHAREWTGYHISR